VMMMVPMMLIVPPFEVVGGAASSTLEVRDGDGFSLLFDGLTWPMQQCCARWRDSTAVGLESSGMVCFDLASCTVIGGWSLVWCSKTQRGVSTFSWGSRTVAGCHLVMSCGVGFLELTRKVHVTFWRGQICSCRSRSGVWS